MKSKIAESWDFLVNHKIFNVETVIESSKLEALRLVNESEEREVLNIRNSFFERCLDVSVVLVNELTNEIDIVALEQNTKAQIWLEVSVPVIDHNGDYGKKGEIVLSKECELSCSGDTFELAIYDLASKVNALYGRDIASSTIVLDKRA